MIFKNQPIVQPPLCKKRKSNEDLNIQDHNDTSSTVVINQNEPGSSKSFLDKPPIKMNVENQPIVQPPPCKKRKSNEDLDNQNQNDTSSTLKKHDLKYDNCTFNNCTFNVSSCNCNKENNSQNK